MPPKAGFSRAKNVGYDDDDMYDDYSEEEYVGDGEGEGMSEEDKEQMVAGMVKVREALGSEYNKVKEVDIQDALWNYYYDVGKSVTFLKNKYAPKAPAPVKPKEVSRFDQAAGAADAKAPTSTGTTKAKTKTRGGTDGEKLAESVEKLVVETRVRSKNLNVVDEYRKCGLKRVANFVVIGHVDHGKSTLMGRLLYDLKVVDERSVDKLRQEAETIGKSSFALAWLMDQTPEERGRGVTVDIATVPFETEQTSFTILDAPGHRDFIPNMIAGVSQADFAVLVVDAQENSFQSGLKGQTKEHALIVRSMGIQRLIVAVNKMDTVSWSKERFDKARQATTAFFETASFSLKNITFIPCAGLSGDNVTKLVTDENAEWYSGPTFLEALEASEPKPRALERPLRLTINDVFRGSGQNPLSISGQIEAGTLQIGDVVLALPSRETATVKAIELPDGSPADWAVAGQIPTLHLVDIDAVHLRLGDLLCAPTDPVRLVKSFTCKMLAFEHVMPQFVDVFRGKQQATGLITALASILNTNTGEVTRRKPRIVRPGEVARVRIELEGSAGLPLEVGGRIVLRDGGRTVGAGLLESYT